MAHAQLRPFAADAPCPFLTQKGTDRGMSRRTTSVAARARLWDHLRMVRRKRWFFSIGLLLMTSALWGCEPASCESVCEQQNSCEGAQQVPDCAAYCDAERTSAEASGCEESYDSLLACQGTIKSCDTTSTFCSAQSAAYLKCVTDACSDDPSKCQGG